LDTNDNTSARIDAMPNPDQIESNQIILLDGMSYLIVKINDTPTIDRTDIQIKLDNYYDQTFKIGDKITKIGSKSHSQFKMNPGFYVEYIGKFIEPDGSLWLIFDQPQEPMITANKLYRVYYAFCYISNSRTPLLSPNNILQATKDITPDIIYYWDAESEKRKHELLFVLGE
jgi:hypothetical protein